MTYKGYKRFGGVDWERYDRLPAVNPNTEILNGGTGTINCQEIYSDDKRKQEALNQKWTGLNALREP